MHTSRSRDLTVEVRLMSDPCLWQWEIKDRTRDEVVDNSWTAEWMAYESREEAYRAGRQRLSHLATNG